MDEVDKIILSSLSEIGCVTKDNITNLKLYTFDELVSMVICCLKVIYPEMVFPPSLPPTMSARYKTCTQFAQICKELGYKQDIGYHTFMYQNISDIRQVLIFLVEHLPKKTDFEQTDENKTQGVGIRQKISEELKNIFSAAGSEAKPYVICKTPFVSAFLETGTLLPNQKIDCKPLEWRDFVAQELPFVDEQLPDNRCFLSSVIALNNRGLVNPTKPKSFKFKCSNIYNESCQIFSSLADIHNRLKTDSCNSTLNASEPQVTSDSDELNICESSEVDKNEHVIYLPESASKSEEDEMVISLEKEINELKTHITMLNTKLNEIIKNNNILKKKLKEKISHESSLQQSIALFPESESNVPKLEEANEKCKEKILKLETQWQRHKGLFLNRRAELQAVVQQNITQKNKLIQEITDLRRELYDVMEEIQKKIFLEKRLSEFDSSSGVQRSEYINRILEIIKKLDEQKKQIENILEDIRIKQKEINNLSGKVERSFLIIETLTSVPEESSPLDEFSKETHKLIVVVHRDINEILTMVEENGKFSRDIKDLENQLMENGNHVEGALKQVTADLIRLKDEKASLLDQMKKYTNSVDKIEEESGTKLTYVQDSTDIAVSTSDEEEDKITKIKPSEAESHSKKSYSKDSRSRLKMIMPLFSSPLAESPTEESDVNSGNGTGQTTENMTEN